MQKMKKIEECPQMLDKSAKNLRSEVIERELNTYDFNKKIST